jgi:hypothetical protein
MAVPNKGPNERRPGSILPGESGEARSKQALLDHLVAPAKKAFFFLIAR